MKRIAHIALLLVVLACSRSWGQVNLQNGVIWEDLRFPANSFNPPGLLDDPDWVNVRDGLYLLGFDASTDESVFIVAQLPHAWDVGTAISPHVHTTQGNATSTSNVVWGLEYSWAGIGTNFPASTTIYATNTLDGVAYKHEMPVFQQITPPDGADESSCIIIRLFRDADNAADTYAADDYLVEFDIHYRVGKLGKLSVGSQ